VEARCGRLELAHGVVNTPAFMPVGTRAAIKGVTLDQVEQLAPEIILANTYHLHLRPGDARIERLGGLHAFIGWHKPILTDSGGYQVFSLADRRRVSEEGVAFQSHLDGQPLMLTPESAAEIQMRLGSDISMVFDECPAWPAAEDQAEASMERTLRWARRGRDAAWPGRLESSSMGMPLGASRLVSLRHSCMKSCNIRPSNCPLTSLDT
jgi:queuine tRNA-ribosyltransferase